MWFLPLLLLSAVTPDPDVTCSNGLLGIEAGGVCCVAECPQCGDVGCGSLAPTVGLTPDDCCVGDITSAGVSCDDAGMAPCIIDSGRCNVHNIFDLQGLDSRILRLMLISYYSASLDL